jgi:hypothetical protein
LVYFSAHSSVFSASVFYLVHGFTQRPPPGPSDTSRVATNLRVPLDIAHLQGRTKVDALRPVLEQLGVHGEIDFVRHVASEHRLIIPVRTPGLDTLVSLDYEQRSSLVTSRRQAFGDAFAYLHKMPGPHNADIRGNSRLMRAWRVVADATTYLVLFITVSGIYLWVALKAERRVGLLLLLAGAVTFCGLVYAIAA